MKRLILAFLALAFALTASAQVFHGPAYHPAAGGGGGMSASDDFNRANESPLASPWTASYGGGVNLVSNVVQSTSETSRGSYYTGTWGADQWAKGTVGNIQEGSRYAGVLVRADGSGNSFMVDTDGSSGSGHTEFGLRTNGTFSSLGVIATTFTAGDVLELEVSGVSPNIVLTCRKNGLQVGQLTGQSGPDSGNPGIGNYGVATIDDWSAGD